MGALRSLSTEAGPSGRGHELFPALTTPSLASNPKGDVGGAVAATLVSLPQAMAYGILAVAACGPDWIGIGVLAGLYGSALTGLLSVILGSNPLVISGPRAATILVLAGLIGHLLTLPGTTVPGAFAVAGATVVLAGLLQVAFGLLRLGKLTDYIPYPVVAGFLNASALLIILSQIVPLTGLEWRTLADGGWRAAADAFTPGPLAVGAVTAAVILLAPRVVKRVSPLVLGLGTGLALYYLGAALGHGEALGGTVPAPPTTGGFGLTDAAAVLDALRALTPELLALILPAALSMAALSSLDAAMANVTLDQITLRRSNANRDLMAQGAANALAGVLGLLPGSGSLARSGALVRGGGSTALGPLLTGGAILVLTAGLAPMVGLLPNAVTAGLLVGVGVQLLDRWTLGLLKRVRWRTLSRQPLDDLLAIALVVATALALNLVAAVAVGVLVSLAFFVIRSARTPVRRCYLADALATLAQGDRRRLAFIEAHGRSIGVLELEGSLFFGSVAALHARIDALAAEGVAHVILDLKRVKDMDATAARAIERLHLMLKGRGGHLVLAYVEPERRQAPASSAAGFQGGDRRLHASDRRLWRVLEQAGSLSVLRASAALHQDLDTAVAACERHLAARLAHDGADEDLRLFQPQILRGMDRAEARRLWTYASRHHLRAGDVIFRQGDAPDSMYFVAAGTVEVSINLPRTDRRMRIQTLSAGAIFGEMAVIDPKPRSATLSAAEDTVVYRLSAEDFQRMKAEEPALAFRLLENLTLVFAQRLRASNTLVAELEA